MGKNILLCLLTLALFVYRLEGQALPVKWGNVSKEELKMGACAFDTLAGAVILCDYGSAEIGYGQPLTIKKHRRIKILKQSGLSEADVSIPYYVFDNTERILGIKAQTINVLPSGKLEKIAVDQIFDVDINDKWKEKRLTFPSVQIGSIIEYTYTTNSENITSLEEWYFQDELPVIHSEFRAIIGENLDYRILYQGQRLQKKYGTEKVNRWFLDNLPGIKDEPFCYNPYDYAEKIKFQLAGYYKGSVDNAYTGAIEYVNLMTTWDKLAEELLQHNSFTSFLNKSVKAKMILDELKVDSLKDREKSVKIYNYVKDNYTWDGKYSLFTKQSLNDFLEKKMGSSAEMNLFLTLLLQEAGLNASPVMASTKSHGIVSKVYPLYTQFNHVLSNVVLYGKDQLLDPTDIYRPYDLLSEQDLNHSGFLLNKSKSRWVDIDIFVKTRQLVTVNINYTNMVIPTCEINLMGYVIISRGF